MASVTYLRDGLIHIFQDCLANIEVIDRVITTPYYINLVQESTPSSLVPASPQIRLSKIPAPANNSLQHWRPTCVQHFYTEPMKQLYIYNMYYQSIDGDVAQW